MFHFIIEINRESRVSASKYTAQSDCVCLHAEDWDYAVCFESIQTLCCSVLECPLCFCTKWTDDLLFSMETLHLFVVVVSSDVSKCFFLKLSSHCFKCFIRWNFLLLIMALPVLRKESVMVAACLSASTKLKELLVL